MQSHLSGVSSMMQSDAVPKKIPTYKQIDLAVALVFAVIGCAAMVETLQTSADGASPLDPRYATFFPLLVSLIIVLASIVLALRALRSTTSAGVADAGKARYGRTGLATAVMAVYGAAIFYAGFWPASSVAIVVMALLLTGKPLSRSEKGWLAIVALLLPGLIIIVFNVFLAVRMPTGGGY